MRHRAPLVGPRGEVRSRVSSETRRCAFQLLGDFARGNEQRVFVTRQAHGRAICALKPVRLIAQTEGCTGGEEGELAVEIVDAEEWKSASD